VDTARKGEIEVPPDIPQVLEESGGGEWTRTTDLRIMRPHEVSDNKENKASSSAKSGIVLQNPHPPRNKNKQSEDRDA
jgi:hypothetical protein